jgi:hypothetical protein
MLLDLLSTCHHAQQALHVRSRKAMAMRRLRHNGAPPSTCEEGRARACEVRVDSTLHADLGGAPVPGLGRPALDLPQRQQVRRPPQLLRHPALAEGTEAARIRAPIRVVYVPGRPPATLAHVVTMQSKGKWSGHMRLAWHGESEALDIIAVAYLFTAYATTSPHSLTRSTSAVTTE